MTKAPEKPGKPAKTKGATRLSDEDLDKAQGGAYDVFAKIGDIKDETPPSRPKSY